MTDSDRQGQKSMRDEGGKGRGKEGGKQEEEKREERE